jgi:hypothetical protein
LSKSERRKLGIDRFFLVALGRDPALHDACRQSAYLDTETGDLCFVYDDDEEGRTHYGVSPEENRENRARVRAGSDRFVEVPALDHRSHEGILEQFLETDWTDDPVQRTAARSAYQGSLTGWLGALECDAGVVQAYQRYREARVAERARKFLGAHGIDPVWR